MTEKFQGHARVQVTVEVPCGVWGPDCTVEQIQKQAAREAVETVERLGAMATNALELAEEEHTCVETIAGRTRQTSFGGRAPSHPETNRELWMSDFGFPYVLYPEQGTPSGLSPAHSQLWKTVTRLVETIPSTWPVRCHELVRALHTVLQTPLALHLQDGYLGYQDHSWLWVGEHPVARMCSFHSRHIPDRKPIIHEGAVILDPYFPGSLPPVVMHTVHRGLALSQGLYRPGPVRTDINNIWLDKLERHFKEQLNPIP